MKKRKIHRSNRKPSNWIESWILGTLPFTSATLHLYCSVKCINIWVSSIRMLFLYGRTCIMMYVLLQVRSAKDHTGEETAPIGIGPCGQTPRTIKTDDALGAHTSSSPNNTLETPGINYCGWGGVVNQSISFWTWRQLTLRLLKSLTHFPPNRLPWWGCQDEPNAFISVIL